MILDRLAADPDLLAQYQRRAVTLRDKFLWSNEKRKYISLLRRLTSHDTHSHGQRIPWNSLI